MGRSCVTLEGNKKPYKFSFENPLEEHTCQVNTYLGITLNLILWDLYANLCF